MSKTRWKQVRQIPKEFDAEKLIGNPRLTADGKFFLGCEDRPAQVVVIPLEDPAKLRSFDLGIGVTNESRGVLKGECRIEFSASQTYASVWANSSEGTQHGLLLSLSSQPDQRGDFQSGSGFFQGDRFLEIDGTNSLRVCELGPPGIVCERRKVSNALVGVQRGGPLGQPSTPISDIGIPGLSMKCPGDKCILYAQPQSPPLFGATLDRSLFAGSLSVGNVPYWTGAEPKELAKTELVNGDKVVVAADVGIWRFSDSLLDQCCLLNTQNRKIAGFAAGGNGVGVVAFANGDDKGGLSIDVFRNGRRTGHLTIPQINTVEKILCSKSGKSAVVSGDGKAFVTKLNDGVPGRPVDVLCPSPSAVDDSDTWIGCGDLASPNIQILNIKSGKAIELKHVLKPIDSVFISSDLVSSVGLYRGGID